MPGALRGEDGSRRSVLRGGLRPGRGVLPGFRPRRAASHASRRPARLAGRGSVEARGSGPCRRHFGLARSLMVTPWFAAGAGIVIAAALAVDSHAALTYVPNAPGVRCPVSGCLSVPGHGPDVATATPGLPFTAGAEPRAGKAAGRGGAAAAPSYQLGYQVLQVWPSGFLAVITMPHGMRPGPWRLRLAFRSARVDLVWGARWRPSGDGDAGTAIGPWAGLRPGPGGEGGAGPGPPGAGQGPQGDGQMVISVTGTPTAPSGCRLDGMSCRFG